MTMPSIPELLLRAMDESQSLADRVSYVQEAAQTLIVDRGRQGYRDAWKGRTGVRGRFVNIETKVDRLYGQVWCAKSDDDIYHEQAVETALDLINYTAFLVLQILENRDAHAKG